MSLYYLLIISIISVFALEQAANKATNSLHLGQKTNTSCITNPEARVRFLALPEKKVVGLKLGALSLVSTTEELLDRKVAAPV
jgi:hypothetical protein